MRNSTLCYLSGNPFSNGVEAPGGKAVHLLMVAGAPRRSGSQQLLLPAALHQCRTRGGAKASTTCTASAVATGLQAVVMQ